MTSKKNPFDDGGSVNSELHYEESAYLTAMSQVRRDPEGMGPPKNVVIVGTKLDLVLKDESLRKVKHEEGMDLARRLNCAAFIETSSKDDKTMGVLDGLFDGFLICALNCYENSIRVQ